MSSPQIVTTIPCRYCRAGISVLIAMQRGNERDGYVCQRCEETAKVRLDALSAAIQLYYDSHDTELPCALCQTTAEGRRYLHDLGEPKKPDIGALCDPCHRVYTRANRDKIRGTKLERDLRLA